MQLTAQDRAERARLQAELTDLAGTPPPAALTVALYALQCRGHQLTPVTNDDQLEHARTLLRDADRHALLAIRASDRRRLLRPLDLQPLGHPVALPHQLARLIPRADAVRYKQLADTGHATLLTIGQLVIVLVKPDTSRAKSTSIRKAFAERPITLRRRPRNDHATHAPIRDQGAQSGMAGARG